MKFLGVLSALALLAAAPARAALSMSQIADQCADADGFSSCWSKMQTMTEQCYNDNCNGEGACDDEDNCTSSNPDCVASCSCVAYTQMIQCALTSCWNMVTSCQYQHLAVTAAENCPLAIVGDDPLAGSTGWQWIPYFPSNASRPGACSCDVGLVYLVQRAAVDDSTNVCSASAASSKPANACPCCRQANQVSVFYDLCPDTDPAALLTAGLMPQFDLVDYVTDNAAACNAVLSSIGGASGCVSRGFPDPSGWAEGVASGGSAAGLQLYSPANVPGNGSNPLSNGPGVIATPLSATITWALGKGQPTQTAVAVTTGSPRTTTGGGGGGSNGGTTTTPGGSGSTPTGKNGAARQHGVAALSAVAALGLVAVVLL